MFVWVYLVVGVMALVLMLAALRPDSGLPDEFDLPFRFATAVGSMVLWGVWGLQSGRVEWVVEGNIVVGSYDSLLFVGLLFSVVMLVYVFWLGVLLLRRA